MGWRRNWTVLAYEKQRVRLHWHWGMCSSLSCAQLRQAPNRFQIWQWQLPPSKWLASALSGRPVCRERHKSDLDSNKWIVKKGPANRICIPNGVTMTMFCAYKDTCVHTADRQTDRQACKLRLLSNLYRIAFLLPNVTNSDNKGRIRREPTNLFKVIWEWCWNL